MSPTTVTAASPLSRRRAEATSGPTSRTPSRPARWYTTSAAASSVATRSWSAAARQLDVVVHPGRGDGRLAPVEPDDRRAAPGQLLDEVGPDEPGRPGDHGPHAAHLLHGRAPHVRSSSPRNSARPDAGEREEEPAALRQDVLLERLAGEARLHGEELLQAALERHEREALVEPAGAVEAAREAEAAAQDEVVLRSAACAGWPGGCARRAGCSSPSGSAA